MERILIFGNTHESREAAQTMRRRGKQVIVCVTTEYARAQLPPGTMCHIGRFDDGQMLSYIRQTNPRKVIDATHPYATATQTRIRRSAEQLGIPCQRMKIENEQEAWRDVVQWVENPAEAAAVLSRLSEENILLPQSAALCVPSAQRPPVLPHCADGGSAGFGRESRRAGDTHCRGVRPLHPCVQQRRVRHAWH